MHYHHLYVDAAGESHWRTVEVTLEERTFAPPAKAIFTSDGEPAKAVLFLSLAPGWNEPIHPTPKRQFYVCLSGRVRVTASDGEAREIGPGDVWRMEDTHGSGHHTEVLGDAPATAVMVQFD
ncbi:MAG: cupin domain-containing protein [Rhodobacteraceae bacterium]|nr:cupin domain-containing protein [Alphaproteobacteria bacterium]NNF72176.1 cupin domain-containing protein [Paracoccaceae bacterium]NNK65289.1 cupin domain-containing protein [Paracoccaceae bacterium]